jgi:hypothetical protein
MEELIQRKHVLEDQIAMLVNQFSMDNDLEEVSIAIDLLYEYGESEFVEGTVFKGINVQCTLMM